MEIKRENEFLIFEIDQQNAGQRVREFLQTFHLSKKKIHQLYMDKSLKINDYLQVGDQVAIPVFKKEELDFQPQKMNLDIVYEDDHLLILNKPAGIKIHPDTKDGQGTLVNGVAYYYQEQGIHHRIRYIHRLDIETTGGIIFAKHYLAHSLLDYWLSQKMIKRQYLALVAGRLKNKKGKIEAPIGKDRHHPSRRRVSKNGDYALTYYQVKKQYQTSALVELELATGRTHQIRVHLSHIGHPILGDSLYGENTNRRHALHSHKIQLQHPILDVPLAFTIPLPEDMIID